MRALFEYDTNYWPAMPMLAFSLTGRLATLSLTGMVDSGADGTAVPHDILAQIGARDIDDRWVRDLSGFRYPVTMYQAALTIGTITIPVVEVISNRQTNEIVIGRDVLNQFIVTLNGLSQMVELTD